MHCAQPIWAQLYSLLDVVWGHLPLVYSVPDTPKGIRVPLDALERVLGQFQGSQGTVHDALYALCIVRNSTISHKSAQRTLQIKQCVVAFTTYTIL